VGGHRRTGFDRGIGRRGARSGSLTGIPSFYIGGHSGWAQIGDLSTVLLLAVVLEIRPAAFSGESHEMASRRIGVLVGGAFLASHRGAIHWSYTCLGTSGHAGRRELTGTLEVLRALLLSRVLRWLRHDVWLHRPSCL